MSKFTRRIVIKNGLAALLSVSSTAAVAQVETRTKGPPVWLDMDQEELDEAYVSSVYAPNFAQVIARWNSNSEIVRNRIGSPRRFAYGERPIEALDVFVTECVDAPINIFIHGGAWRQGKAETYAFPAELFVNSGVHYVVLDFSWVQDVGNNLFPIVDQLRRAVAWVYQNTGKFSGDANRIYLSGHSSGGHLAGVLLTTDWEKDFELPSDIIKGGLCCSGIFDLKPVRLSARRNYINFTDSMEQDLSPIRHIDKLNAPLIVAYGSYESPEFIRQSEEFAKAASDKGKSVHLIVGENYNHFEIIETLANPNGILGSAILQQMRLTS